MLEVPPGTASEAGDWRQDEMSCDSIWHDRDPYRCPACEARQYDKPEDPKRRKERLVQSVDWEEQVKARLGGLLREIEGTAAPFKVETAWANVNADPRTRTIDITFNGHLVIEVPETKSGEEGGRDE
jgi:hypothetical protein